MDIIRLEADMKQVVAVVLADMVETAQLIFVLLVAVAAARLDIVDPAEKEMTGILIPAARVLVAAVAAAVAHHIITKDATLALRAVV